MAKKNLSSKSLPPPVVEFDENGDEITPAESEARKQVWHPSNVAARFQHAAALSNPRDVLHLVATSLRKAAEHLNGGVSVQHAFELVAEEIEDIATEAEAAAG